VSASGDHLLAAVSSLLAGFAKNEESTDKAAADAETAMEMVVNEAGVGVGMEGRATAHTATVLVRPCSQPLHVVAAAKHR
jgi:tartrate dehydratase alpha subunit/fumarate hydratase class I-like protein